MTARTAQLLKLHTLLPPKGGERECARQIEQFERSLSTSLSTSLSSPRVVTGTDVSGTRLSWLPLPVGVRRARSGHPLAAPLEA
jgi:hypothetical protein